MKPATARRVGFTLLEILVVLALVAILVALAAPAIERAREQARRTQCSSNLRQFGLAIHGYLDVHGVLPYTAPDLALESIAKSFSLHAFLLPYLEESALYDLINFQRDARDPYGWEESIRNHPAGHRRVALFQCPSDPNIGAVPSANSYRASLGDKMELFASSEDRGVFVSFRCVKASEITDGFAQTAFMSERAVSRPRTPYQPFEDVWFTGRTLHELDDPTEAFAEWCAKLQGTPSKFDKNQGLVWLIASFRFTRYNHILTPNSTVPDCTGTVPQLGGGGVVSARSYHDGGVNVLFGDGAVRFISSAIDRATWRAIATRNGGEAVDL